VAKGKYGYKWAKWITEIEVTDKYIKGYWESADTVIAQMLASLLSDFNGPLKPLRNSPNVN